VHFSATEIAFSKLVYTPSAHTVVIELADGSKFDAILQDIQFHPVTDNILHVDFYQTFADKEVTMDIPVEFIGSSKGVKNGGVLRKNKRSLRVKAIPGNLPDSLTADITPLKIGGKLYITELESEGFKFMHPDNTVVCQVRRSRNSVADDEEEEEGAEAAEATPAAE
jgi:large subunit ribosomal protein L25